MAEKSSVIEAIRKRVEGMPRFELLNKLRDPDMGGTWRDEAAGYGAWATIVRLEDDGLHGGAVETFSPTDGPFVITEADLEAVNNGQAPPNDELDAEGVQELIDAGANIGTEYWTISSELRWGDPPEIFETEGEARDEADNVGSCEFELLSKWEDFDDHALRKWVEVSLLMKAGFSSIYEVR